jgi:hypothetical protein
MWGELRRPQTAPPPGYVAPTKYDGQIGQRQPPGFLAGGRTLGGRQAGWLPSGRQVKGSDGTVRQGGTVRDDGSAGRVMRGGGLQWRQRIQELGRNADPNGRAGVGGGREDAAARDQGRRGQGGSFQWAFPRPNRPWTGGTRGGRQSYEGLPEYQRPRDGQRFDGTVPRGRLGGLLDPYNRPRSAPSWGRERSQPHYEPAAPPQGQQGSAPPAGAAAPQRAPSSGGGTWGGGAVRGGGGRR